MCAAYPAAIAYWSYAMMTLLELLPLPELPSLELPLLDPLLPEPLPLPEPPPRLELPHPPRTKASAPIAAHVSARAPGASQVILSGYAVPIDGATEEDAPHRTTA